MCWVSAFPALLVFAIVDEGYAEEVMVVPKDIKNNVLNAIYKEMGMSKIAHGIAFSLPVTDTAGLVKIEEPAPNEA